MATVTIEEIMARARTIATQRGGDATQSALVDNKGGLMALLPSVILNVYRQKARDQKFLRDITTRSTVSISSGTGTVPDEIMREFLDSYGDFTDDNGSMVTYFDYAADYNSGVTFDQLGYVVIQDGNFLYRAPAPDLAGYTGNLFVTTPSIPAIGTSMSFPSDATIDDVCLELALALQGQITFEGIQKPIAVI